MKGWGGWVTKGVDGWPKGWTGGLRGGIVGYDVSLFQVMETAFQHGKTSNNSTKLGIISTRSICRFFALIPAISDTCNFKYFGH